MEDEHSNFSDDYYIEAFEAETNLNNNKDDILLEEEIIPGEEYPNQEFEILEHESDAVCAASSDKSKIGKAKIDETEPEFSYWRYFFTPKTPQQTKIQCRICSKLISRGTDQSTSALNRHLECWHKSYHALIKDARKQMKSNQVSKISIKPIKLSTKRPFNQITLEQCKVGNLCHFIYFL